MGTAGRNDTGDFLAFDLGAESGRAVAGRLKNGVLSTNEIHRFPTGMLELRGRRRWNVFRIYEELRRGLVLSTAASKVASVGIDTWGVDFALMTGGGDISGLPYSYRDRRTDGAMESFFRKVPRERVYELTGVQLLQINTLFQLESMVRDQYLPTSGARLLFIPDLLHYLLCGSHKTEFTIATTSQLLNSATLRWEPELFAALGLPITLMQDLVMPGTIIGGLDDVAATGAGLGGIPVTAVATHDTASAVAAVPSTGKDWAFISSGTWSLMGVESDAPIQSPDAYRLNFTNEGGLGGRWRVLKNIAGMWLLQECRRAWDPAGRLGYDDLVEAARTAEPFRCLLDPDDEAFMSPSNMPLAIEQYCRATGQPSPGSKAVVVRCTMESLALKYRTVLAEIRKIYKFPVNRIHVVGGGSRNSMLCQFTADATGLPVIAGPAEATAVGNLLVQAGAMGLISGPEEMRRTVAGSFDLRRFEPENTSLWDAAYQRYREICG